MVGSGTSEPPDSPAEGSASARLRFPARLHLRRAEDFQRVRRAGRTYRHAWLTLNYAANGLNHNRYGFIVSKQIGTAVTRNRVRRRLRESVRLAEPQLAAGWDIVVVARPPVVMQPFDAVQRTLLDLLHQSGLGKERSA